MYNKIFTKILDSSIWLEPTPTRLLWMTLIAAMDEDGFAAFASIGNLAHRARLTIEETTEGVNCLESPDKESSDPDNEGRRIERVPGGWIILNAQKYRELVTRTVIKEQTRSRVARHREKKRAVTKSNGDVTHGNETVTPSDTATHTDSEDTTSFVPKNTLPTLDQAKEYAPSAGVSPEIAEIWWNECEARPLSESGLFTDRDGNAIRKWKQHLTSYGRKWAQNAAQRNAGRKSAGNTPSPETPRLPTFEEHAAKMNRPPE